MDAPDEQPKIDERLADLRRRRAEVVDVLAETILEMWLQGRRAARGDSRSKDVPVAGRSMSSNSASSKWRLP
jgi:hypothetical protein